MGSNQVGAAAWLACVVALASCSALPGSGTSTPQRLGGRAAVKLLVAVDDQFEADVDDAATVDADEVSGMEVQFEGWLGEHVSGTVGVAQREYQMTTNQLEESYDLAGGGRLYMGSLGGYRPYVGLGARTSFFESSLGTQVGAEAGLGLVYTSGHSFVFDIGATWTEPLIPAEEAFVASPSEVAWSGWVVSMGFGLHF